MRLLALRTALAAVGVSLVLAGIYFTKYVIDTPNLRRLTLEEESATIIRALRRGQDPSGRPYYRRYPQAYAFRVYDGRLPETRQLLFQENAALFESVLPSTGESGRDYREEFKEGLRTQGPDDRSDLDRWMLTDHEDIGARSIWVQVAMVGDPAWRWVEVMANEMFDHVLVPVLTIVPPLALAIMVTIALALRPLKRTSRQAAALGAAVGSGARLAPLSTEKLSVEFYNLVTAINAMLTKLEHAFDLQKQFTSDAAHELRTPVAILLLQIAELPPGPTVEALREGLRDLAALIDQLLQFAQAEDVAREASRPSDVAAIARKVCEDLAVAAYGRHQLIEFETPEERTLIAGHPALFEIAVRNLVDNAMKHSPDGTTITVAVEGSSRVVVADRGPGIPNEHKELVFSRFWRADRRSGAGAGIGLALVRRIAELHGGDVKVEDRSGGGSRFVIDFARRDVALVKNAA